MVQAIRKWEEAGNQEGARQLRSGLAFLDKVGWANVVSTMEEAADEQ
jgi:hypothetical protein